MLCMPHELRSTTITAHHRSDTHGTNTATSRPLHTANVRSGLARQGTVVRVARHGDHDAWEALVEEYSRTLWAITKQYRLNDAEAADAVQTTWLRLLEHVDEIRESDRIAGWLATTVRRLCMETDRRTKRWQPVHDPHEHSQVAPACQQASDETYCPERAALRGEHAILVRQVLAELSEPHQRLIRLLMSSPSPSYRDVAAELSMPVGSIGPTRARILARMRDRLATLGLEDLVLG